MSAKHRFGRILALMPCAAFASWTQPAAAHVASIVIDSQQPAFGGAPAGSAGAYVTVNGRVFGGLDPTGVHNAIIQDIGLAPLDSNGLVPYIATFQLVMPANPSAASGVMFYEVPNRGGSAIPSTADSLVPGAISLQRG